MKDKRKPGQSQLDYLWVTYKDYEVSNTISETPEESIPSQALILNLLKELGNSSVGSISLKGNNLVLYNQSGLQLSTVDVSELNSSQQTVTDFGSKIVQNQDIEEGCPFPLYTRVYYITLSNGKQFWAEQSLLKEAETSTIKVEIINNSIIASLKIDEDSGNVVLTTENGLKATLPINGLEESIRFQYLSQQDYDNITDKESGTIYFIKDKSYFYFEGSKIGSVTNVDLFEVTESLPATGDKNKIYLVGTDNNYAAYVFINDTAISIGNVGNSVEDMRNDVDDIKNSLIWKSYD